jgi:hypothetical protein
MIHGWTCWRTSRRSLRRVQSQEAIFAERLHVPESKQSTGDNARIKGVMNRLGWNGPELLYFDGKRARGYRRRA